MVLVRKRSELQAMIWIVLLTSAATFITGFAVGSWWLMGKLTEDLTKVLGTPQATKLLQDMLEASKAR